MQSLSPTFRNEQPLSIMTTTPETTYSDIFNVYKQMLPYPLDGFQEEASHIDAGKSVVVCAPTGAGKTAIAEFAALKAMVQGRKLNTRPRKCLGFKTPLEVLHAVA